MKNKKLHNFFKKCHKMKRKNVVAIKKNNFIIFFRKYQEFVDLNSVK